MKSMVCNNFTLKNIRKIWEYHSLRHMRMRLKEIVDDARMRVRFKEPDTAAAFNEK